MRRIAILLVLIFAGACAPEQADAPSSPDVTPLTASPLPTLEATALGTLNVTPSPVLAESCARGDYFDTLESSGQARRYILHVPATYDPEGQSALVLVFHGAGIGAERFVEYTRFSRVAEREGFLIVYPEGLGEAWNASPGSQDVTFVSDLIAHLQRRCRVDPARIYATGHSNGGGMVHRLGCELADQIAAIGPVSGAYQASSECSPARPVPVFAIHGTTDPIVSYEGIPDWAAAWAERNGCDPEPVDVVHNVLISERQWTGCREGADVVLYTIADKDFGHNWTHDLIDIGQTIWDFFKQHPR